MKGAGGGDGRAPPKLPVCCVVGMEIVELRRIAARFNLKSLPFPTSFGFSERDTRTHTHTAQGEVQGLLRILVEKRFQSGLIELVRFDGTWKVTLGLCLEEVRKRATGRFFAELSQHSRESPAASEEGGKGGSRAQGGKVEHIEGEK